MGILINYGSCETSGNSTTHGRGERTFVWDTRDGGIKMIKCNYGFNQLSMKCGLEEFGRDGLSVIGRDLRWIHRCGPFLPVNRDSLSQEEKGSIPSVLGSEEASYCEIKTYGWRQQEKSVHIHV